MSDPELFCGEDMSAHGGRIEGFNPDADSVLVRLSPGSVECGRCGLRFTADGERDRMQWIANHECDFAPATTADLSVRLAAAVSAGLAECDEAEALVARAVAFFEMSDEMALIESTTASRRSLLAAMGTLINLHGEMQCERHEDCWLGFCNSCGSDEGAAIRFPCPSIRAVAEGLGVEL